MPDDLPAAHQPMKRPIYLDHHATTPTDAKVVEAMLPYLTEQYGNPASQSHFYGWETAAAVEQSREVLADAIHAEPEEIIWTSGATESNNLAIKGIAEGYFSKGRHLITVCTEHRAVLHPMEYLKQLGFEITILQVDSTGLINLAELAQSIRPDTLLVSVMAANSEIGVLQPLVEIGALCRTRGVLFHTDASQALGKIPLDVEAMNIDLMSMTAHKLYGPKGIGALYVRQCQPRIQIKSQMQGGQQEQGLRSGTLATHQIVGFAKAVEVALSTLDTEAFRIRQLRDRLWQKLQDLPGVYLNGHPTQRLPGSLNVSFADINGAALLLGVRPEIAVSSGSACASGQTQPSDVLTAIGRDRQLAAATLRFGIGRFNTEAEIDRAANVVIQTVLTLRHSLNPST
jgi:cysteine desulfurase